MINTNLNGPKRVCETFIPLLDYWHGRIVNVSSGAASMYMTCKTWGDRCFGNLPANERMILVDPSVQWKQIQDVVSKEVSLGMSDLTAYGLSKAGLTAYTMTLAREHPRLYCSSCSPGFIATNMYEHTNFAKIK